MKYSSYPKVLILSMTKIKADESVNLLIRSQFGGWPKNNIAQIYSGEVQGIGEFCGHYYLLKSKDRAFGRIYKKLRGGVLNMVAVNAVEDKINISGFFSHGLQISKKLFGDWLIGSGLWEVLFYIRISKNMMDFVAKFQPDIIYCQGYSLSFAALPILISKKCNIPICYQTTDDWPSYTYKNWPMAWLLQRSATKLVSAAKVRMAFGDKMKRLYDNRYGVSFHVTYHLDDPIRFNVKSANDESEQFRIVYTGSLSLRRYEAIQDLLAAVRSMPDFDRRIRIDVYCPGLPKDMPRELLEVPEISFMPLPSHDDLPKYLASASILFLPESFSVAPEMIDYAISSKAHLYMMSGKPILVYGPAYSGTVEYAVESGWAYVIDKKNINILKESLLRLFNDKDLIEALRLNASVCVRKNHDILVNQERFRALLVSAIS